MVHARHRLHGARGSTKLFLRSLGGVLMKHCEVMVGCWGFTDRAIVAAILAVVVLCQMELFLGELPVPSGSNVDALRLFWHKPIPSSASSFRIRIEWFPSMNAIWMLAIGHCFQAPCEDSTDEIIERRVHIAVNAMQCEQMPSPKFSR